MVLFWVGVVGSIEVEEEDEEGLVALGLFFFPQQLFRHCVYKCSLNESNHCLTKLVKRVQDFRLSLLF